MPLPAPAPDRLTHFANQYFDYAEDLSLRGAPELAAPFYRQAYALLLASVQPEAPYTRRPPTQAPSSPPAEQSPQPAGAQQRRDPKPPWQAKLQQWRQQLTPQTAAGISRELKALMQSGAQSPELHNLQGLAALQLQDPQTAERSFRSGLALDPRHYSCLVNLAGLELQAGRSRQAIALLQQALGQSSPDSPEAVPALNNLALAHQQQGEAMEAALLVHRIHRLKPGYLRSARLEQAAHTLEQMGEDQLALDLLRWLQQHQPTQASMRQLALLLERQGDFEGAAQLYQQTLPPPASG